jgi:hypothetical protein
MPAADSSLRRRCSASCPRMTAKGRRRTRLRPLRPAHERPRLRDRSALHQENPRPPRPLPAGAGQAPTGSRDPPRRRARRGLGRAAKLGLSETAYAAARWSQAARPLCLQQRVASPVGSSVMRHRLGRSARTAESPSRAHPVGPPAPSSLRDPPEPRIKPPTDLGAHPDRGPADPVGGPREGPHSRTKPGGGICRVVRSMKGAPVPRRAGMESPAEREARNALGSYLGSE